MSDMIKNEDVKVLGGGATQLMVEHYSDATRILQIRGFTREATISRDMTTSSNRSLVTTIFDIDSIPIMLTARTSARGVKRGQLYIKVSLLVDGVVVGLLMAGYVSEAHKVFYPGGDCEGSTDGKGYTKLVSVSIPEPGEPFIAQVPTGALWYVKSVVFSFNPSLAVGARIIILDYISAGVPFMRSYLGVTIPAPVPASICFAVSAPQQSILATYQTSFLPPDTYLPAGYSINGSLQTSFGGEIFSDIYLQVEEWINP